MTATDTLSRCIPNSQRSVCAGSRSNSGNFKRPLSGKQTFEIHPSRAAMCPTETLMLSLNKGYRPLYHVLSFLSLLSDFVTNSNFHMCIINRRHLITPYKSKCTLDRPGLSFSFKQRVYEYASFRITASSLPLACLRLPRGGTVHG